VGGEFLDLISQAGLIVKLVLVTLFGASIMSWALIVYKWRALRGGAEDTEAFLEAYRHDSLEAVFEAARELRRSSLAVIFLSGCEVMQRGARPEGQKLTPELASAHEQKLSRAIQWSARSERQHAERGLTFLATVGSSAPFVGLFGTVVGIINTFQGIGAAGNASLAVVGPGMAEALIATAVGLLAAIPASVAYNVFIARIEENNALTGVFARELIEDFVRLGVQGAPPAGEAAE
jgi:biopolymer transport protein TolQ